MMTNMRNCTFQECAKPHVAKGFCQGHYRQQSLGKPLTPLKPARGRVSASLEDRISYYTELGPGNCIDWTGRLNGEGYGEIYFNGVTYRAHRLAYSAVKGTIPSGYYIDHICGRRCCINPEHLRLATPKENMENLTKLVKTNKSGYRGVSWHKASKSWVAQVGHNKVKYSQSGFVTAEDARDWAIEKRNELFTHNDRDRVSNER